MLSHDCVYYDVQITTWVIRTILGGHQNNTVVAELGCVVISHYYSLHACGLTSFYLKSVQFDTVAMIL